MCSDILYGIRNTTMLLCIPKVDAADPEMQKGLLSVVIPVGGYWNNSIPNGMPLAVFSHFVSMYPFILPFD